jgi:hypothetical protein
MLQANVQKTTGDTLLQELSKVVISWLKAFAQKRERERERRRAMVDTLFSQGGQEVYVN